MADVIAMIVAMFGRCYCLEADGIACCGIAIGSML